MNRAWRSTMCPIYCAKTAPFRAGGAQLGSFGLSLAQVPGVAGKTFFCELVPYLRQVGTKNGQKFFSSGSICKGYMVDVKVPGEFASGLVPGLYVVAAVA